MPLKTLSWTTGKKMPVANADYAVETLIQNARNVVEESLLKPDFETVKLSKLSLYSL